MEAVTTRKAPAAIGPYSQAIKEGDLLFVSGQLPIDADTGEFNSDDIVEQAHQCLRNLQSIALAAGTDLSKTIKTSVLVTDLSKFADVNAAYGEFFTEPFPARATYQVAALPRHAKIEIEAIISLRNE